MAKKHDIIWLESIDSTNDEAKRHISDIDNLSVLSAWEQRAGRGQRGNKWSGKAGENLMFSIILKYSCDDSGSSYDLPQLSAHNQFVLNEIASLSVVDFLFKHEIQAKVKWPNDIYVGNKKICGILIENSLRGRWLSSSIVGIGLNINQRNFDVNLPNPTSMVLCLENRYNHSSVISSTAPLVSESHARLSGTNVKETFDLHDSLEELMDIFISNYNRYLSSEDDFSPLRQRYIEHLWRLDQQSQFIDYTTMPSGHHDGPMNICDASLAGDRNSSNKVTGREFSGIIRGLSEIGNLLVEDLTSGTLHEFGFKEIGYIL